MSLSSEAGLTAGMSESSKPRLLRALAGETLERPPVWFMRQAGRSLPEYRELRTRAGDFISFCHNPEMAAEARNKDAAYEVRRRRTHQRYRSGYRSAFS